MSKVIRDNYWRMMKHGRFRAFRNIPVGWVTQSIHSTDRTERLFRVAMEAVVLGSVLLVYIDAPPLYQALLVVAVHTAFWLLFGNFWVYMLDSFDWVRNGGIRNVLQFVRKARNLCLIGCPVDAILIYGSMSRGEFRDRSDLDLRIVRKKGFVNACLACVYAQLLKAYSFFVAMPVDMQVVDSMRFLDHQMREDELPIVVYLGDGFSLERKGWDFDDVEKNPAIVLKSKEGGD